MTINHLSAIVFLLFSLSISAQENASYPEIRQALDAKNLWLAKKELNKVFPDNPNDPALTFYQAEIWIQEGENEYARGNFRNAWEYYSKAHEVWGSHPTVRRRYEELRGKKQVNNSADTKENNQNKPHKPKRVGVGLPWMFGLTGNKAQEPTQFVENTAMFPEDPATAESNLSFNNLVPAKDGKSLLCEKGDCQHGQPLEKNSGGTKIVYISDSSNLEEVKVILSEINQDLKQIKSATNKEEFVTQIDANSITLSRNFILNTLGLFGIVFVSLVYFVFRLSASVNELKRKR